jgi:hypothetical protein
VSLITASNGTTYYVRKGSYGSSTISYRTITLPTITKTWTSGSLNISFDTLNDDPSYSVGSEARDRSTTITITSSYMPTYNPTCTITYSVNSIDASAIYSKATAIAGNPASFT